MFGNKLELVYHLFFLLTGGFLISQAKLIWQCRRGMLELDLLFNRFIQQHLVNLTEQQLSAFEQLLSHSDPDLYQWLMGNESPDEQELMEIVTLIRTQRHL